MALSDDIEYLYTCSIFSVLFVYTMIYTLLKLILYMCDTYIRLMHQRHENNFNAIEYFAIMMFISLLKIISYLPYTSIPINIMMVLVCIVSLYDRQMRQKMCKFIGSLFVTNNANEIRPNLLYSVMFFCVKLIDKFNFILYNFVTNPLNMHIHNDATNKSLRYNTNSDCTNSDCTNSDCTNSECTNSECTNSDRTNSDRTNSDRTNSDRYTINEKANAIMDEYELDE